MPKVVIDIKEPFEENDILVFKKGQFHPVRIKTWLPELDSLQHQIDVLKEENTNLMAIIVEQKKLIDNNTHMIMVDRGLEDE